MKVLVTGSSGFIGRRLIHAARQENWREKISQLVGISRAAGRMPSQIKGSGSFFSEVYADLTQEGWVRHVLNYFTPDAVIHLAGNPLIRDDSTQTTHANVVATHNLLANLPTGTRFVLASSAAVYGDPRVPGEHFHEDDHLHPTSVYGASKMAAEALVRVYHSLGRVSGLCLRYVANVGPGATHGVVKDILAKLRSPSPYLELLGDEPGSVKHYTHVDDTVAATLFLGLERKATGTVNVCNDDTLSIKELAEVVMRASGIHKPLRWLGAAANWKGDNPVVRVDNCTADMLGWRPTYHRSADAVTIAVQEMMQ